MNPSTMLLGLTVLALAAVAGRTESTFHPRHDLLGRTILALAAILSALSLLAGPTVSLAIAARHRLFPDDVCAECATAAQLHPLIGAASAAAMVLALLRLGQVIRRHLVATRSGPSGRIAIVDTTEPLAYAVPRGDGCIVVSTGMLDALDGRERQVVFAHERAHLRQNHHRHLLIAACAEALLPFLRPLATTVRLATERCADEEAVLAMSGDRRVVARAILRAAVHTNSYERQLLAFNGGSVVRRVSALEGDAPLPTPTASATNLGAALIVGLALTSGLQAHELLVAAVRFCSI